MSKETKQEEVQEVVLNTPVLDASANANVAPESFDWESFESGLNEEDRKEKAELEQMYDTTLEDLHENEVFKGQVVRITDKEAIGRCYFIKRIPLQLRLESWGYR